MAKRLKVVTKFTPNQVREAAIVLGTSSWQAREKQYTKEELRVMLSAAGKLGGRPRKEPT